MKKLPIGIQHFPSLIEDGFLYVDKTRLIVEMITESKGHFLSRPRRFGKSLLVSTLESIFSGQKELFSDCWIRSSSYTWETFPVINLDFSRAHTEDEEALVDSLNNLLIEVAQCYQVELMPEKHPNDSFSKLIQLLAKEKPVVVLIDEYDYPILSQLSSIPKENSFQRILREFFITIKSLGKYIRYAFLTGVSKFSKVSLFSGMNNLEDISLDLKYATLAGITENELALYYQSAIEEIATSRNQPIETIRTLLRKWYNGYRFARSDFAEKVYNPVSVHLFLKKAELANYWFSTATPTFAIDLIKQRNFPLEKLDLGTPVGYELEIDHETDRINLTTLLYQTGYLTIKEFSESDQTYLLKFPNFEVEQSFHEHLLRAYSSISTSTLHPYASELKKTLNDGNLEKFFELFNRLLSEIPYAIQVPKEAYYHSLLYLLLKTLGFQTAAETMTNRGRVDMTVSLEKRDYLFEIKINGSATEALNQILEKEYYKKFISQKELVLVGVNFDQRKREINEWIEKKATE